MSEKHLSSQFDSELNGVSSRVMELGGMVESQIHHGGVRAAAVRPRHRPTA
jgi:phosphate uptake regulator